MRDFAVWLKAFLERRGLRLPNGEMLFTYRTSKEEYLELRAIFTKKLEFLRGQPWTFDSPSECALLVLYASEWWRREYAGGAWRWLHILQSLTSAPIALDVLERTYAIERGLKAWGHRPSDDGKKYLGAIVLQGGLPLQLVAKGDGSITRLLVRGTRLAQLFSWDSARLEAFFGEHDQELVQHLREVDIHRLFASIVLTVLSLRNDCQLAGIANPIATLDRLRPAWRDQFPIAVDDESAEPLLIGLVREAARAVKSMTAFPVLVTRSLVAKPDGETFELVASVLTPSSIALSALASACGIAEEAVPQAFSLELREMGTEARATVCEGRQLLGGDDAVVMLSGRSKRLSGDAAANEHVVVLRCMGQDMHPPVGVPGADALDDTLPWVFAARDTGMVMASVGSCRLPEETAYVAAPDGTSVEPDGAAAQVQLTGVTEGLSPYRWVYAVRGAALVKGDAGSYLVRTSQPVEAVDQLVWRGKRVPYGAKPMPVFLGIPQLYRYSIDGQFSAVAAREIEWVQAIKAGQRIENIRQHRGPVDAWILSDGIRQRRFRMVLLSPDAQVKFSSGESEAQGTIVLQDWALDSASSPASVTVSQNVQATAATLELRSIDQPPASIMVNVCWPLSSLTVELELPFPSSGGRFFGTEGAVIQHGASLPLRRLQEVRARVFDRNPNAPKRYVLRMELRRAAAGLNGSHLYAEHGIPVDRNGIGELRLLDIETVIQGFLSQCDELDARIELSLCVGQLPISSLFLRRYDAHLERHAFSMTLSEEYLARTSASDLDTIQLMALPLLEVNVEPVALIQAKSEGVPVGRWDVGSLRAESGPWLIHPAVNSKLQLRPTLYSGFSIGTVSARQHSLCPLGAAMEVADPATRLVGMQLVIAEMAADLDHVSWRLVAQHYQQLSHLPLSALDSWRTIARSPAASITTLLKLSHDLPRLMQRMRDELGVVWEGVPRQTLAGALVLLSESWATQFKTASTDATVRTLVGPVFRSLGQISNVLGEMVEMSLFQAGFDRSAGLDQLIQSVGSGSRALARKLWAGDTSLLQRFLLRTHADDRFWPRFDLTRKLVHALPEHLPSDVWAALEVLGRELLWMPTLGQAGPYAVNLKEDVANVPLLLAIWNHFGGESDWWWQENRLAQLRQIRSFDPSWFEVSFRTGMLISFAVEQELASSASGRKPPSGGATNRSSLSPGGGQVRRVVGPAH